MTILQIIALGVMAGLTPSLIVTALLLWRAG